MQHNAAQYDNRLPAWALPPPLMCLHFHPMAVSRWFSAASLKQVSNMAITRSGSLAISLSVFMISAAFLPKGKFFAVLCVCVCVCNAEWLFPPPKQEEHRWEVVVRLRAKMRTSFPVNLSITFYCSRYRCRPLNIRDAVRGCSTFYLVISALIARVLSWVVILQEVTPKCLQKVLPVLHRCI